MIYEKNGVISKSEEHVFMDNVTLHCRMFDTHPNDVGLDLFLEIQLRR